MAASSESKLRQAVESRLRERLRDLARSLEGDQAEVEAQIKAADASPSVVARPRLLAASEAALQRHCERVVADLVALRGEDGAASEWLAGRLDEHVEAAVSDVAQWLGEHRCAGVAGGPEERRRVLNLGARLKAQCREQLARAETAAPSASEQDEVDDRLPLWRRRVFDRDLAALLAAAVARQEPLALVMIDLDHFKRVNDTYGHPAGDEVLLSVARAVTRRLGRKGRAYRYGGEELALLLPTYSVEEALGLAERIRKDIAAEVIGTHALRVTASFGAAEYPESAPAVLLEQADRALYAAKAAGRNCVRGPAPPAGETSE